MVSSTLQVFRSKKADRIYVAEMCWPASEKNCQSAVVCDEEGRPLPSIQRL